MDREHRDDLVKHMLSRIVPVTNTADAEDTLRKNVESLKLTIERTVQGGVWSNEPLDGVSRIGLGILLDRNVVDHFGVDEVLKRLRVSGLKFTYSDLGDFGQFNAEFWVVGPKL